MRKVGRSACTLALMGLGIYGIAVGTLYAMQRNILFIGAGNSCRIWANPPAGYRIVQLRTADGLNLKALYRPALPGRSTILFFHGNGDNAATGADLFAPSVAQGHGALLSEYRGYCGNPGSPDEQGLYRDGEAASRWLRDHGVPQSRIVLAGYSLGTGVASKIASESRPAGLVLIAAYASIGHAAAQHYPWAPARQLVKDQFPTIDRIGRVNAPILLLQGADDRTVFPDNGVALARVRPDAMLMTVPGEGHTIAFGDVAPIAIRNWLAQERL